MTTQCISRRDGGLRRSEVESDIMIELAELIEIIDINIEKAGGLSHGGHIFWGDLTLHIHNGFRKENYEYKGTGIASKEKNSRLKRVEGSNDLER